MRTVSGLRMYSVHLPEPWIRQLQRLVDRGYFANRAEAIRMAIRDLLQQHASNRKRDPNDGKYRVIYYEGKIEKVRATNNFWIAVSIARKRSYHGYAVIVDHNGHVVREYVNGRKLKMVINA